MKRIAIYILSVLMVLSMVSGTALAATQEAGYAAITINAEAYTKGVVANVSSWVNFRSAPADGDNVLQQLNKGTEFGIVEADGDYYKVILTTGATGYIARQYVEKVVAPEQASASGAGAAAAAATATPTATAVTTTVTAVSASPSQAGSAGKSGWTTPANLPSYSIAASDKADWDAVPGQVAKYKQINSHVNGYIHVPNTNISFPTVIYKDNDYYLTRNVYRKKDSKAVPYFDFRNLQSDQQRHLILYGHNMQVSKTMFNNFIKYRDIDFYRQTPVIRMDAFGGSLWEVVSSRKVKPNSSHIKTKFASNETWLSYITDIQKSGEHYGKVPTIPLRENDVILTILTCDRSTMSRDGYKARYLVHYRRIA